MSYVSIPHAKERGEWGELCFMARAAEHGLRVVKPWVVILRSAFVARRRTWARRANVLAFFAGLMFARSAATAALTLPTRSILLPPSSSPPTPGTSSRSPPSTIRSISGSPHRQNSRYAQYKEAWHLLKR